MSLSAPSSRRPAAGAATGDGEIERLRKAARLQPRDARLKTALGDALATAGRDREAEKAYREALKIDGRPLDTRVKLVGALTRLDRRSEAERLGLKLLAVKPERLPPAAAAEVLAELLVEGWCRGGEASLAQGLTRLQKQSQDPQPLLWIAERLAARGLLPAAAEAANQAIDRWQDCAAAFARLAAILLAGQDAANAVLAARRAVKLDLSRLDARLSLAQALIATSDYAGAEAALQEALLLDVDHAEVLGTYANLLFGLARNGEAIALLDRAVARHPELANLHRLRSAVLVKLGRDEEALAAVERAVALAPRDARQQVAKAEVLLHLDRLAEAEAALAEALRREPDNAPALTMQGRLHIDRGELTQAEAVLQRAVALAPERSHGWNNLGILHNRRGNYAAALEAFEAAGRTGPLSPATLFNKAFALLALGRIEAGWDHYEMGVHAQVRCAWRMTRRPLWEGQDLSGQRLGVIAEQGVGDQLFYISCLPDLLRELRPSGARVALEVHPKILPLVARSFPEVEVRPAERDGPGQGTEAFDADLDYVLQLGSLPARYRRSLEAFPERVGFVTADPARVAHWRARLAALGPAPKIGFCWRSMLLLTRRTYGYLSLEEMAPLLDLPGLQFVSLQYGVAAEELAEGAARWPQRFLSFDDEIDMADDLDEVAALMSALDAVVCPSTTVANMAGALGCRTYRFTTQDGTWIKLGSDRLPWYPRMTIHSVPNGAPLTEALDEIAAALSRDFGVTA